MTLDILKARVYNRDTRSISQNCDMKKGCVPMNKFMLNETSYHGAGAISAIPTEIKARGFQKVFVATDPDLVKFGISKKVTDLLDQAGIAYSLFTDIKANPTIENVQNGVKAFKEAKKKKGEEK